MMPVGTVIASRLLHCGARTALISGLMALSLESLHLLAMVPR